MCGYTRGAFPEGCQNVQSFVCLKDFNCRCDRFSEQSEAKHRLVLSHVLVVLCSRSCAAVPPVGTMPAVLPAAALGCLCLGAVGSHLIDLYLQTGLLVSVVFFFLLFPVGMWNPAVKFRLLIEINKSYRNLCRILDVAPADPLHSSKWIRT